MSIRRFAMGSVVLAGVLMAGQSVQASTIFHHEKVSSLDKSVKAKTISFSMRNDSKDELTVKAGDDVVTLAPGAKKDFKLVVGATIVAQNTTSTYAAGTVIATVSQALSNNTVAVR